MDKIVKLVAEVFFNRFLYKGQTYWPCVYIEI